MSQIDKVNYIPVLFWFIVLLVVFYIVVFTLTLPLLYSAMEMRVKVFSFLGENVLNLKASSLFLIAVSPARKFKKNILVPII